MFAGIFSALVLAAAPGPMPPLQALETATEFQGHTRVDFFADACREQPDCARECKKGLEDYLQLNSELSQAALALSRGCKDFAAVAAHTERPRLEAVIEQWITQRYLDFARSRRAKLTSEEQKRFDAAMKKLAAEPGR